MKLVAILNGITTVKRGQAKNEFAIIAGKIYQKGSAHIAVKNVKGIGSVGLVFVALELTV